MEHGKGSLLCSLFVASSLVGTPWAQSPEKAKKRQDALELPEPAPIECEQPSAEVDTSPSGMKPHFRRVRLLQQDFEKSGYAGTCKACDVFRLGFNRQGLNHSQECRLRIIQRVQEAEYGRKRIEIARKREVDAKKSVEAKKSEAAPKPAAEVCREEVGMIYAGRCLALHGNSNSSGHPGQSQVEAWETDPHDPPDGQEVNELWKSSSRGVSATAKNSDNSQEEWRAEERGGSPHQGLAENTSYADVTPLEVDA